jgi:hypothetical protein
MKINRKTACLSVVVLLVTTLAGIPAGAAELESIGTEIDEWLCRCQ